MLKKEKVVSRSTLHRLVSRSSPVSSVDRYPESKSKFKSRTSGLHTTLGHLKTYSNRNYNTRKWTEVFS